MCKVKGCKGWTSELDDMCYYHKMWGDDSE